MNKQILRSALEGLTEGQTLTINFRSSDKNTSGDYVFLGSRRGRGKGGSLLAELSLVGQDGVTIVGTKDSDNIVNVVIDGTMHGLDNECDLPIVFEARPTEALELKKTFKAFLQDNACPKRMSITSSIIELNGEFTVVNAKQLRGRVGQVQLETQEGVKFCSYRHSGVIQNVRVLDD
jgi:hypothetical protein